MRYDRALVWFRRDLRSEDHAALHHALTDAGGVHCVFVFDTEILDALESRTDSRVEFIWESVAELARELEQLGGGLIVRHARAREEIPALAAALDVQAVYCNHDYEPQAIARDLEVQRALGARGIALHTFKDQVIFERDEVLTREGRPFSVFTPYKAAWLARLGATPPPGYPVRAHAGGLLRAHTPGVPSLETLGFARSDPARLRTPAGMSGARALLADFQGRMEHYHARRDYPSLRGPSYLSAHLRFGTVSVRELVRVAWDAGAGRAGGKQGAGRNQGAATWLSELIWREFYAMILFHQPRVVTHAFRANLDQIAFANDPAHYAAWCEGRTGYPLVDAGMRQLAQTGYMHNRLRMVTASFLVKDLHVDWRWGERWFARQLNDYDLASNNGGWQWAASTGCDAQPWFRIFNPVVQSQRFDPEGKFIRRYLPELARVPPARIHSPWTMNEEEQADAGVRIGADYPAPVVDHARARAVTLAMYGAARQQA